VSASVNGVGVLPEVCRCACGYRCGGPGYCDLDPIECLLQDDDRHYVKDCEHRWDGPMREVDHGMSATCSACGMSALAHDLRAGP